MARVVLPLLGVEATGQIGHALVYMPIGHATDGLTSVRVWTKPSNPQSETQGDVRLRTKAVGYGVGQMYRNPSTSPTLFSTLITQIKAETPAGQIWNAFFVKTCFGAAFVDIDASLTAFETAANTIMWQSVTASLGWVDKDIAYASIAPITAAEIMFVHARAAYDLALAIAPNDAQLLTNAEIVSFAEAYLSPT